ncbi:MAG: HAMP domain-containing protein [SAR202 cluster bacterium]|nr:HAMP domain-containing protein [SAR202 cluster bacterium]
MERSADEFTKNPALHHAVRNGDEAELASLLLSARIVMDVQHLEVLDISGARLGHEHQVGTEFNESLAEEVTTVGLYGVETSTMISVPQGWFLVAVRPLKDALGVFSSVAVGIIVDINMLEKLNFGRADPLVVLFNESGEVSSASYASRDASLRFPVTPDSEAIRVASEGRATLGTASIQGVDLHAAYSPVVLGSGAHGVFGVVLTSSPVLGLRDQLIANYIMVTAALVLLVLGVGYVVTKTITRRILRLRDSAVEIGKGNLDVRVDEESQDEMGILAHEFNRMADSLNEKNRELGLANRNLEKRVFERTEELEDANARLLDAQAQMVRNEKLAAIGELSNGVPHDLRSPLGAIRNGVFFLKARLVKSDRLTTDPKVAEFLDVMDDRITRCDKIIGDLISYTHILPPELAPVDLLRALDAAFWVVGPMDRMTIVKDIQDDDLDVQADYNQLVKVFANLVVNAREAMPDGGELTISLKKSGPSAEMSFTDNGMGIEPDKLEKVFDPLYTTKIQGTGLGLAVCQQIISKHDGRLDVASKVGEGTTLTIWLPLRKYDGVEHAGLAGEVKTYDG